MKRLIFLALLICVATARAEDQTSKHRLIGLSAAERVDDLQQVLKTLPHIQLEALDAETAEVTLKYDPAKVVPNFNAQKLPAAEEFTKRLDEALRNASRGTFSLKPLSALPKDKLAKIDIKIGVLDCKACRYAAYIAVANLDGVENARVEAKTRTFSAWIDEAKTNREVLETALKKANVELEAGK